MAEHARTEAATLHSLWKATFLVSLPFGVLSFALPIYGRMLKASAFEIGALFSAAAFFPVIVRPFLGRFLDRDGRRPFLLAGLAAYAVSMALLCAAKTVLVLGIGRFVQGMGQALLWMSAYAIVADLSRADGRGRGFGAIDEADETGAPFSASCRVSWPSVLMQFAGPLLAAHLAVLFGGYAAGGVRRPSPGASRIGETRPAAGARITSRPLSLQIAALMGIVFVTGASTAMVWPIIVIFLEDRLWERAP